MEVYKEILGYENKYYISNYGNIKNSKGIVLKPYKINSGYLCQKLWLNNVSKAFLIHRLVAEYFIDNVDNKPNVDHINEDRLNNNVTNLRWVTQMENVHSYKNNGFNLVGLKHPRCSVSKEDIESIRCMFANGVKRKDIYPKFNCCKQTVNNIINKKYNYL